MLSNHAKPVPVSLHRTCARTAEYGERTLIVTGVQPDDRRTPDVEYCPTACPVTSRNVSSIYAMPSTSWVRM
ncbi:MAG: hypothetical protein QXQ02_00700 [Halobacteria archaeon]